MSELEQKKFSYQDGEVENIKLSTETIEHVRVAFAEKLLERATQNENNDLGKEFLKAAVDVENEEQISPGFHGTLAVVAQDFRLSLEEQKYLEKVFFYG